MFRRLAAVTLLFLPALVAADATAVVIDLGGPRHVRAELTVGATDYRIRVEMLSVRAFDAVTNIRLNRDKARLFALQALARHLTAKPDATLAVRGVEVEAAPAPAGRFALIVRLPLRGVEVSVAEKVVPAAISASRLLTAKADHAHTLDLLTRTLAESTRALRRLPPQPTGRDQPFEAAVATVEEEAETCLRQFAVAVRQELLLLEVEKAELLAAADAARARHLDELRVAVRDRPISPEPKP